MAAQSMFDEFTPPSSPPTSLADDHDHTKPSPQSTPALEYRGVSEGQNNSYFLPSLPKTELDAVVLRIAESQDSITQGSCDSAVSNASTEAVCQGPSELGLAPTTFEDTVLLPVYDPVQRTIILRNHGLSDSHGPTNKFGSKEVFSERSVLDPVPESDDQDVSVALDKQGSHLDCEPITLLEGNVSFHSAEVVMSGTFLGTIDMSISSANQSCIGDVSETEDEKPDVSEAKSDPCDGNDVDQFCDADLVEERNVHSAKALNEDPLANELHPHNFSLGTAGNVLLVLGRRR
ncbi:hypothetical protein SISNIDRAFT_361400 [Sistotremastrum niveocremeum HHB9708]|uniref:Uncharacterized protein n=1 Tax=Sistotremastrum niveocremeum HHB9708 TaxID=1314777 RepID=A0A164WRQ4_9AGAM|nr:hypothetical protein SISNIDRAFT_361400 [Sistotremastrum niveocremeum HHB9708]